MLKKHFDTGKWLTSAQFSGNSLLNYLSEAPDTLSESSETNIALEELIEGISCFLFLLEPR